MRGDSYPLCRHKEKIWNVGRDYAGRAKWQNRLFPKVRDVTSHGELPVSSARHDLLSIEWTLRPIISCWLPPKCGCRHGTFMQTVLEAEAGRTLWWLHPPWKLAECFPKPWKLGHKKEAFRLDPTWVIQVVCPTYVGSSATRAHPQHREPPREALIVYIVLGVTWTALTSSPTGCLVSDVCGVVVSLWFFWRALSVQVVSIQVFILACPWGPDILSCSH